MSDSTQSLRVRNPAERPPEPSHPTRHARAPVGPDSVAPTIGSDLQPLPVFTRPPVHFPGYVIEGELGRGGMGVVYRARHLALNRPVALKVIIAGPHASEYDKARFRVEAEAAARLRHPNIVQVYDVGEHDGFAYIALELVEGQTLRRWQDGHPLGPKEAARIAVGVGRAIQHAHDNGIIHRDIKPANILLSGKSEIRHPESETKPEQPHAEDQQAGVSTVMPKVTDFGLAKPMEGGLDLTITGMACGTPNYMAPELVTGKKPTTAVDVYSFGAVLFELLTGRPPITGESGAEVLNLVTRIDPPSVRRINAAVPRDLAVIVDKCLQREPTRRYPSAAAVVADLESFLAGRPIVARPAGPVERAVRWCRRNPVAAMFLAVLTAGFAVTGGLALALANSAAVEHAARADAESARDQLRDALDRAETARQTADAERAAADTARATAVQQKTEADAERKRALANLGLARSVIRSTLEHLGDHPRIKEPDFREFRTRLIRLAGDLRLKLEPHAGSDADALADLGGFAHWIGFLEYLNGNMAEAAAMYFAAAETFRRWSVADPADPAPRSRRGAALTNAGNAAYHAGKLADAEARHREAIAVLEELAARDRKPDYQLQHLRAYGPLYEMIREQGRWHDGVVLCRQYVRRAHEMVARIGTRPAGDVILANALQCLGQMLDRTGKPDAGECYLIESLALRDRIAAGTKNQPGPVVDAARGRLVFAAHLTETGRPQFALGLLAQAAAMAEEGAKASPSLAIHAVAAAETAAALAEALRKNGQFARAEPLFDRAIGRMEELLRRHLDLMEGRHARRILAEALVGKGNLLNSTQRHRDAIAVWERLASDDPNPQARVRHRIFALQSLVFLRDWKAAAAGAEKIVADEIPPGACCELARVWCRIAKAAADAPDLDPADRAAEVEKAFDRAVGLLEKGKAGGAFGRAEVIQAFASDRDFDPVRDRFDPRR